VCDVDSGSLPLRDTAAASEPTTAAGPEGDTATVEKQPSQPTVRREQIRGTTVVVEESVFPGTELPQPTVPVARPEQLAKGRRSAVSGTAMYWAMLALEDFVLTPLSFGVHTPEGALVLVVLSVPVSALKVAGASVACAGASNVYEYRVAVSPTVSDIHVWKPYAIGWGLTAGGTILNMFASLSGSAPCLLAGSMFLYGRDIAWGVASIWSLIYATRHRLEEPPRDDTGIEVVPLGTRNGGSGVALRWRF
jgi:hypothetical protein